MDDHDTEVNRSRSEPIGSNHLSGHDLESGRDSDAPPTPLSSSQSEHEGNHSHHQQQGPVEAGNDVEPPLPPQQQNNDIPQNQQHPFFNVRDRLFHALFYRIAVTYARSVPRSFRIAIEIFALFKV